MSTKRHMCVCVLIDGEYHRDTHFEVVEAADFDDAIERIRALEAALRPVANHKVIDRDNEFIGGCYAIDVVQTAIGLVGSVLQPLRKSETPAKPKQFAPIGEGTICSNCTKTIGYHYQTADGDLFCEVPKTTANREVKEE